MATSLSRARQDPLLGDQSTYRYDLSIAATIGLACLGLGLWHMTFPGMFALYDSGIYFGAAVRFADGIMPYRDFLFVQPPGIVEFLAPIGFLARAVGTDHAFEVARILTLIVSSANVALASWLLRPHGRLAMAFTGLVVALLPDSFLLVNSVKINPYLLLFVLVGAIAVLRPGRSEREPSRRATILSGVCFGVAALFKLWAIFPFLALCLVLGWKYRKRMVAFAISTATTFAVGISPFLVMAPRAFLDQVVVDQLFRKALPWEHFGALGRLVILTGLSGTTLQPSYLLTLTAFCVVGVLTIVAFSLDHSWQPLDWFIALSAFFIAGSLFLAAESFTYYYYFDSPFLIGLVAIDVHRLSPFVRRAMTPYTSPPTRTFVAWVGISALAITVTRLVIFAAASYGTMGPQFPFLTTWVTSVDQRVPPHSCVVTDESGFTIVANRFVSSDPHCPTLVDSVDIWMTYGDRFSSPPNRFVRQWEDYFQRAQYVVLTAPAATMIPWNHSLTTWFNDHFSLVSGVGGPFLYRNDRVSNAVRP